MKVSHRITRLATAGLIAGALAAPVASARPAGRSTRGPVPSSPRRPSCQSVDDGFDWASAAIGAGAPRPHPAHRRRRRHLPAPPRAHRRRALARDPPPRGRHHPPSAAARYSADPLELWVRAA